ncbi:MAG: glycosyltransferase family 2 protein [Candidatus Latescibacterota bacterium]
MDGYLALSERDDLDKCDVSVVLAAFNEAHCIRQELDIVCDALDASSFSYEVLVIDDGSSDETAQIVEEFDRETVSLIRHRHNQGSGAARKTGTLAARGTYVVWSDVDLTYPNGRIPDLVHHLINVDADQVVGARDSERGTMKVLRVPAKFFIRKLACFLTGTHIPDLNSGLRVFRRAVGLRYVDLLPKGFSCVTTITLAFLCNGHSVEYMPIRYAKRAGQSKFHPLKDTYRYITQVARMVTYFEPLKVFLPMSIGLIGIGAVSSAVNLWRTGTMQEMDMMIALGGFLVGVLGLIADLFVQYQRKLERLISSLPETGPEKSSLSSDPRREF